MLNCESLSALLLIMFCMHPFVMGKLITYNITIDASKETSKLLHFWESTGMCPPLPHQNASYYFLSQDMLQNLIHIGSVPHSGIKQVRMHWLLDMVTFDEAKQEYNFTNLDILLKTLKKYDLNPGFELMGSPSNRFTNFDDHDQVIDWMMLVTQLARRYIKLFGLDYVSRWNFETWNEPDHKDFDNVVMSVEGFLKYYDACSEGLKAVDESLIFGGPGGSCRKESFSKRCWELLEHCMDGTNYITGGKGSRIDFIAMHKKGGGMGSYILETELETISKMHEMYPGLVNTPIFNDEADPMVGWSKSYPWRSDATYPAIVTKVIAQHQYGIISNKSRSILYSLLSNDNGFLSYSPHYFTQRTLNARFQMNNTVPHHVHLVKKPIHAVMVLMSKLGNLQLQAHVTRGNIQDDNIGVIASVCHSESGESGSNEIALLTYASDDTNPMQEEVEISLNLQNLDGSQSSPIMMMSCDINNEVTNPAQVWLDAGSPDFPEPSVFEKMHSVSEPLCSGPVRVDTSSGRVNLSMSLLLPGVYLHHICWMPLNIPEAPIIQSVTNITSGQVLIAWSDLSLKSKCIKSYEIQLCFESDCISHKILNSRRVISNSFVYISPTNNDKAVHGFYRVRVVDFWDRYSKFSNVLVYPR